MKEQFNSFYRRLQKLNVIRKQDGYANPRLDKYINSLGKPAVFSTLGANSGYCQVTIRIEDWN